VPANRPAPPPATTTTRTTVSGPKSDKGAGRGRDKSDIINDCWMVGDDKEGSVQKQTTTNHCALKAGKRRPAERALGDKKGEDDANEEDE